MKNEYVELIATHDETLHSLREVWIEATKPHDRAKAMSRINKALDHRLTLMAKRDAAS